MHITKYISQLFYIRFTFTYFVANDFILVIVKEIFIKIARS